MFEDESYKANNVHKDLYEALQKSLELDYSNQRLTDQEEARKKRRKRRDTPRSPLGSPPSQPPPLHPLACASGAPGTSGSSQLKPPSPPPSTGISGSTPYESTGIAGAQELSPSDDLMHDDSAPDEQVQVSDDQDSENDHPPAADVENNWASALASSYEPPTENSLLAKTGNMMTFLNWYCRQTNKSKLTQADLEGQAYEVVKVNWENPEGDQVRINVNRPLPLDGPRGHVTIQIKFFFNKDLEYLRFGNKGSMPVLSISKMKAARYFDFSLELLVPEQMWIEDVCTYDTSAKYGIAH
ncbi:hypothetical protein Tco_0455936 [Tanacetum coccineum]